MRRYPQSRPTAPAGYWSSSQAYILAAITLFVGFAAGYFFHGSGQTSTQAPVAPASQTATMPGVDASVAPMLRQLEQTPRDPALLAHIGNTYYDAKDYPKAIEYYRRSLDIKPDDVDVRTDMGTAIWYAGDADGAIKELEKSLQYQPNHGHTLFNIGIVKWQGKNDTQGALASWNKLLALNPNYPDRPRVEQLIQQVKAGS